MDIPRQTEVGNLDDVVLGHEDVPGRQISVDALLCAQKLHAFADLNGKKKDCVTPVFARLETTYLTGPFSILEPRDQEIVQFYVV